ncbi:hypothetical protein E2C01_099805 [Portunus trituberculatus]|uniref:Uncharacterized protein n=1 Tax=Portunus trituberculatus TaxID=210409 RepID=A0A5B7K1A4_PORTR|nr:hypothetical protein [Portunus trituberculatus]
MLFSNPLGVAMHLDPIHSNISYPTTPFRRGKVYFDSIPKNTFYIDTPPRRGTIFHTILVSEVRLHLFIVVPILGPISTPKLILGVTTKNLHGYHGDM